MSQPRVREVVSLPKEDPPRSVKARFKIATEKAARRAIRFFGTGVHLRQTGIRNVESEIAHSHTLCKAASTTESEAAFFIFSSGKLPVHQNLSHVDANPHQDMMP